jgi:hypothetical protein
MIQGDIMQGSCETSVFISGNFSNIERIVLTANGNLQRIMSAYYGMNRSIPMRQSAKLPYTNVFFTNGRVSCDC